MFSSPSSASIRHCWKEEGGYIRRQQPEDDRPSEVF